jgi:hypothetical protein
MANARLQTFNPKQRIVYDAVMESYRQNAGKAFFVHSAGGGGKTYTCNTIAASIRADGEVVLCVASSAIAALLLDLGRTTHSRFKVPIPIHEQSNCNIGKQTQLADVIQKTKLIIFDEVPMQHCHVVEAWIDHYKISLASPNPLEESPCFLVEVLDKLFLLLQRAAEKPLWELPSVGPGFGVISKF